MGNETLYEKLNEYSESDFYPFHMPGHKRNIDKMQGIKTPYEYDITEIDGFDNLHEPEGLIKERLDKVTEFYESKRSYYLINGSTCGILASISAISSGTSNKKILMARNSHKAAYNAVFLNRLDADYLMPEIIDEYGISGGINPEAIRSKLENESYCCVYITSPTYEGIVSDIKSISDICREKKIPLVVDEAHGAHFSMHERFPVSALELGADIVIQSLHKTLPALTQTAILHISKNAIVDADEVERFLKIYQSSSPSYVLMASIDRCLDQLMKDTFVPFELLCKRIDDLKSKALKFTNIKIMGVDVVGKSSVFDVDMSKLVIFPKSNLYTGQAFYKKLLEKYHLQMEMSSLKYIIAMTSINDSKEGFDRLYSALDDIDREIRIYERPVTDEKIKKSNGIKPLVCKKIYDAVYEETENIDIQNSEGKIAGDFIYQYPPGIPLVAPGEMITGEIVKYISNCNNAGISVIGMKNRKIKVLKENWRLMEFKKL